MFRRSSVTDADFGKVAHRIVEVLIGRHRSPSHLNEVQGVSTPDSSESSCSEDFPGDEDARQWAQGLREVFRPFFEGRTHDLWLPPLPKAMTPPG